MNSLRIRQGRKTCGLSLGQAARLLGVTVTWLSSQETVQPTATHEQLKAMAALYGTSVAWLLGKEPTIPTEFKQLLRNSEGISFSDKDILLETMGMWATKDE